MKLAILDDYQDTIRTLDCFKKVAKQDVTIWKDHTKDVDTLAKRLADTEVLVCIRERTPIRAPLLDRLDRLKMVTQVGVVPNIDVPACTRRGVIVSKVVEKVMHPDELAECFSEGWIARHRLIQ